MTIQSWSGGKDSTASIILEHICGLPKSKIVFVEAMFDHSRGISGELPEHISFIREKAIPTFESWGYTVDVVRDESDYIQEFFHVITRSKNPKKNGKYRGFFIGSMCVGNDRLKIRPLRKYQKQYPDAKYIVGIASDEPKRLERMKPNRFSLLAKYGYTEQMAKDLCEEYGLLSPIYKSSSRSGCWFCPNQSIIEFAKLEKQYPELWRELEILSHTKNLASSNFRFGMSFDDVKRAVDCTNGQMRFFE